MTNPTNTPTPDREHGGWPPVPPPAGQPYASYAPPAGPQPPKRSWVARHKVLTAVLAVVGLFVVLGGIGAALGGSTDPSSAGPAASAAAPTMPPISSEQAAANSAASNAPSAPPASTADDPTTPPATTQAKPKLTTSQEQAVGAAKDYLDTAAFSRAGLIEQLSSSYGSGFSKADATFAVDYLNVNWKEQAVLAAKEYLATTHFSRAGLIQQLSSAYGSKFTRAEATYAADQVGL